MKRRFEPCDPAWCTGGVETWRPIVGWEGRYEVSDHGQVRSLYWGDPRLLSTHTHVQRPYAGIGKRLIAVHLLELEAFVGPRPDGLVGCHWDDNPWNNHLGNLRWGTYSDNLHDSVRNGTHQMSKKTHCPRGHPLQHPNLHAAHWRNGRRTCLACHRAKANLHGRKITDPAALQPLADQHFEKILREKAA